MPTFSLAAAPTSRSPWRAHSNAKRSATNTPKGSRWLKHGPLALVTPDTPVFAIVTGDDERARETLGNIKEVQARGAPVIAVTDGVSDAAEIADETLMIPETTERVAPVLANVQLQLFSYHLADALSRPIDKLRNLAKSVTVE